jgi:hypothetical protein
MSRCCPRVWFAVMCVCAVDEVVTSGRAFGGDAVSGAPNRFGPGTPACGARAAAIAKAITAVGDVAGAASARPAVGGSSTRRRADTAVLCAPGRCRLNPTLLPRSVHERDCQRLRPRFSPASPIAYPPLSPQRGGSASPAPAADERCDGLGLGGRDGARRSR